MPTAPTGPPPVSAEACRASARSQSVTGLERCAASTVNSRLMQTFEIERQHVEGADLAAGFADEQRHVDAEAGVVHPVREAHHLRRDARDLVDHDHRGALAANVDGLGDAVVGEFGLRGSR